MLMLKTGQNGVNDSYVLPDWLRQELPDKAALTQLYFFREKGVNTVCQQAKCPNWTRCFKNNQATFLILGDTCTRNCSFCNVKKGHNVKAALEDEPLRLREAVKALKLRYVVITSVTRDDLDDGGAGIFAQAVQEIRGIADDIKIELLIPDFAGNQVALKTVVNAKPDVLGHNIETVARLYPLVRPQADYARSLEILRNIKKLNPAMITKSSLLLGMGEREEELVRAIQDLRDAGCDILIFCQYLAPSRQHYPVAEFIAPEKFEYYRNFALSLGIRYVLSGPKVRSSYKAEEVYNSIKLKVQNEGAASSYGSENVPRLAVKGHPSYA